MTDTPPDDDWLRDDVPFDREQVLAGARKAPKRPNGNVTQLRPLDQLADDIDNAPTVAGPNPARDGNPGDGLDPPEADSGGGDLPPAEPGGTRSGGDRPRGEIWRGCPVTPLGVNGDFAFLLDANHQMRALKKAERMVVMSLFGHRLPALCYNFPKWIKDEDSGAMVRRPGHFDGDAAAMAIYAACSERGPFSPDGAVRGVGAWVDDDGRLVYHTGNKLLIEDQARDPSLHQGKIYPAYPAIPHPADASKDDDKAAAQTLEVLGKWNWTRPEIDPMLALGMVGAQMLCGALHWRPTFWLTAERSAGKSNFQDLLKHLHGPGGLVQSADPTKAGITSAVGHSSLPVALDEIEPGQEQSKKASAIIDLARIASSGSQWLRGSADQKGASGNIYSSFFFSSILIPGGLTAADRSRMIILSLLPISVGTPDLKLNARTWRQRGAQIKRTLIDRWPTWQARYDLWYDAFAEYKLESRSIKNYATTLAMAQMAQSAEMPTPDELTGWTSKLMRHIRDSIDDVGSDSEDIVTYLLSAEFDPFHRGERHRLATWFKAAGWRPRAGYRLFAAADEYTADLTDFATLQEHSKRANKCLAGLGLRVSGTPEAPTLFVATKQMQGLRKLFEGSDWANGAWTQSLHRIKGAYASKTSRYLEGIQTKGTEIPFSSMPGLLALDSDANPQPDAAPQTSHSDEYEGSY